MRKQKEKEPNIRLAKLGLATAIVVLVNSIIELIIKLLEVTGG